MCEQIECSKLLSIVNHGNFCFFFWLLYRSNFSLYTDYASMCMHQRHMVVGLCVYTHVCNSHFSKVAKNQALENAVQAPCDNIS